MTEKEENKEIHNFLAKKPLYVYLLMVLVPWIYLSLSYNYPAQMLIVTLTGVLVLYCFFKLKHKLKLLFDKDINYIFPDDESNTDAK